MNLSNLSGIELIKLYSDVLSVMKEKKIIRSKNITGDLGEYIVIDYYTKTKGLPKLQLAPPSTKNIDAISVDGERYSIKCITTNTTGVFHGIEKDAKYGETKQLFEYVIIIKLDEDYQVELILELDWKTFFKHKYWHSRMNAHNLYITKSLLEDAKIIFQKDE